MNYLEKILGWFQISEVSEKSEVGKYPPELTFSRLTPKSAINLCGDVLTLRSEENIMNYKKVDGREVSWERDFGIYNGRALYEIELPKEPGWDGDDPFEDEELEQVEKEIRHGLYELDAQGVIFNTAEYMEALREPILSQLAKKGIYLEEQ